MTGVLRDGLRWAPAAGATVPMDVMCAATKCWRCHKSTTLVIQVRLKASECFPGYSDISTSMYKFDDVEGGKEALYRPLPEALLREHGIGAVRPRYSKTAGAAYLSNGCVHCDALQGQFYESEHLGVEEPAFRTTVMLPRALASHELLASEFNRWWFDESVCEKL